MARPPSPVPLHRVHIQLPAEDAELFKSLGDGQLSAGVRRAASLIRRMGANMDANLPVTAPDQDVVGVAVADPIQKSEPAPPPVAAPNQGVSIFDVPLPLPKPESGYEAHFRPAPSTKRTVGGVYTDIQPIDDDDEPWTQEELAELKAEQAKSWAAAERLEAARANAAKP